MFILDDIEKLINERGSAVVLRERLELAKEQFAVLERKTGDLALKVEELEAENKRLRVELQQRAEQIRALEAAAQEERTGDRPEIEQRILLLIARHSGLQVEQIGESVGLVREAVIFHLNELCEVGFIDSSHDVYGVRGGFYLVQEGRRYLMTRGLLK